MVSYQRLGQKSWKKFRVFFFLDLKTPKGHFEINWPLEVDKCVSGEFWTFPTSFAVDDVVVVVIWWWWFWPRSFHWCFIPSLLILYNLLIKSVLSNSWIFKNQIKICHWIVGWSYGCGLICLFTLSFLVVFGRGKYF